MVAVGPRQQRHLAACLASLAAQTHPPAELVLAPWGDVDPALTGAGPAVRATVLPVAATANDARNAGTSAAGTPAVLHLDATDTLRPEALAVLGGRLVEGVDVVAGQGHRLAERLWRRDAVPRFDPAHGRFPWAALPAGPVIGRRLSGGEPVWATPFGTVPPVSAELASLVAALEGSLRAPWLADLVAAETPAFLDDLEHAEETDVARFAATAGAVLDALGPDRGLDVPFETRVRLWLLATGRAALMSRMTVARWFSGGQAPTRVAGGRVFAVLDTLAGIDVPESVLEIRPTASASLQRVRGQDDLLRLTVFAALPWVDFAAHPPELAAALVDDSGERIPLDVRPGSDPAVTRWAGQAHQNHDAGLLEVTVDPLAVPRAGRWRLEVTVTAAGATATTRVTQREPRGSAGLLRACGPHRATFDTENGVSVLAGEDPPPRRTPGPGPQVEAVVLTDRLVLSGAAGRAFSLALVQGGHRVDAEVSVADGRFEAVLPLEHDPWGLGSAAVPTGTWHLEWSEGAAGGDLPIPDALATTTPLEVRTDAFRARVLRGLRGQLLLQLAPPLADDELGPWAQQRLLEEYAATTRPVDDGLALFSSYAGTGATDSPRAIFEELHRRRPELRVLWAVADGGVRVPEGAEPVLVRSRAWYAALATAGLVVSNVETDRFFRTRSGQRLVQTFHGYPSKSMGLGLWRSKNHSPLRQQLQLDNTMRNWSVALTPTPEMDRHYREQYSYEGPILHHGYPRDDALVGEAAVEGRAAARARLGLADDDVAVLYAPTWRDDVATNFRAAPLVTHLDVGRLAAGLGPGHVVLLRGHRFHQPPGSDESARILDVSTYPEINDLILAADAAVLDYTSLRFDFALTGKPMVFLVPDLEEYAGASRGFLYPFTESAPGPLVATTEEVLGLLRDLDGLRAATAADLAAFNETFNTWHDGRAASRVVDALLEG